MPKAERLRWLLRGREFGTRSITEEDVEKRLDGIDKEYNGIKEWRKYKDLEGEIDETNVREQHRIIADARCPGVVEAIKWWEMLILTGMQKHHNKFHTLGCTLDAPPVGCATKPSNTAHEQHWHSSAGITFWWPQWALLVALDRRARS